MCLHCLQPRIEVKVQMQQANFLAWRGNTSALYNIVVYASKVADAAADPVQMTAAERSLSFGAAAPARCSRCKRGNSSAPPHEPRGTPHLGSVSVSCEMTIAGQKAVRRGP